MINAPLIELSSEGVMQAITRQQARQFILSKQGLIGQYRFIGKDGAYDYVRQAGCIQLDR